MSSLNSIKPLNTINLISFWEKGLFLEKNYSLMIILAVVFVAVFALLFSVMNPPAPSGQAINQNPIGSINPPLPVIGLPVAVPETTYDFASNMNSLTGSPKEFKAQIRDTEMGLFDDSVIYTYNGVNYSIPVFESIGIQADALYDYVHIDIDDLITFMPEEGDFNYTVTLNGGSSNPALGIPLDFDASTGDSARIPFMGKMYDLQLIDATGTYVKVILFDGVNTVTLINTKGYPYDPNNQTGIYDWKVVMQYDSWDSNKLQSIAIVNSNIRWDDDNPIFVNGKAKFVDNFSTFQFKGFEQKPSTILTIGESCQAPGGAGCIKYVDGNNLQHNIPFFIQVPDNTTSSFVFDGATYYYKSVRAGANTGSLKICSVPFSQCDPGGTLLLDVNYVEDRISSASFKLKNPFYFRYMVTETYGHVWLLLTGDGGAIQTKFDKRILLTGTDLRESGSIGFNAYVPDELEFVFDTNGNEPNGDSADTNYFIAHFALDSDNDGVSDTTVFIDTAIDRLVQFPNNNLANYINDVVYSKSNPFITWGLRWDSPNIYSSRGYTEHGSKLEILEQNGGQCTQDCMLIFKATMPKERAKVLASVYR
ncbi:MAG: hypothetical protein Q7S21_07180 [archaeon]|nr:hypothetical protein [archaeon]